jgi:hypothetical protein
VKRVAFAPVASRSEREHCYRGPTGPSSRPVVAFPSTWWASRVAAPWPRTRWPRASCRPEGTEMKVLDTIAGIAAGMALTGSALRIADQVALLHARPCGTVTPPAASTGNQLLVESHHTADRDPHPRPRHDAHRHLHQGAPRSSRCTRSVILAGAHQLGALAAHRGGWRTRAPRNTDPIVMWRPARTERSDLVPCDPIPKS